MYQLLKQIAIVGIKTEAAPQPDEALRAVAGRGRHFGLDARLRDLAEYVQHGVRGPVRCKRD